MRLLLILASFYAVAMAQLQLAVSYPYIKVLAQTIGGDEVAVTALAKSNWDPHFVVPRPSLISTLRNADGLIINGAELETGWIPPLLQRANNRALNSHTILDLSQYVTLHHQPVVLDRALGDVHPDGNPHFHLDPHNIPLLAKAIASYLSRMDPDHQAYYKSNLEAFDLLWAKKLALWDQRMALVKNKKVVQYHEVFTYFLDRYGIETVATLEPLPGISPSSKHTMEVIEIIQQSEPCCILHDVYHPTKTGEYIANRSGIALVVLPHDVADGSELSSLEALYTHMVDALSHE
jgi:zinc/manganese transport system substrate-binding protein